MKMGMKTSSRIDVVPQPGIMLPPGFTRAEDVAPAIEALPEGWNEPKVEVKEDPKEAEMKTLFERYEASKSDSVGWVQKDEVELAKERIKESLGFSPPPMAGFYMAVVIHEEKFARTGDGQKTRIINAKIDEEKYRNPTGLVVAQGPWCYSGSQFKEAWPLAMCRFFFGRFMKPAKNRPWCRIGDWVILPRHEGQMVNYRGVPMMMIPDTKIYTPVENPDYVTRDF